MSHTDDDERDTVAEPVRGRDSGGDRARARKLAGDARAGLADVHNALAGKLVAEIDAWIAAHR